MLTYPFAFPIARSVLSAALVYVAVLSACGGQSAPLTNPAANVSVDEATPDRGVDDKGRDPAVVAIDVGGEELCSGALIAPDAVLTARHCLSQTEARIRCPAGGRQVNGSRDPSSIVVLVGDDVATAAVAAWGREVVTPPGDVLCGADIALLLLDRPIGGIAPLALRQAGIAAGDHVRTVGYGKRSEQEAAGKKTLREHVTVFDTTMTEFRVGEATCTGDSGGPAFDEANGELVGVVSRGGPTCEGPDVHNVYTRTDAFLSLIDDALLGGSDNDAGPPIGRQKDGGASKKKKGAPRAQKLATGVGEGCHNGSDCSTGLCVTEQDKQYCSRRCGLYDPCAARFKCTKALSPAVATGEDFVCIEK